MAAKARSVNSAGFALGPAGPLPRPSRRPSRRYVSLERRGTRPRVAEDPRGPRDLLVLAKQDVDAVSRVGGVGPRGSIVRRLPGDRVHSKAYAADVHSREFPGPPAREVVPAGRDVRAGRAKRVREVDAAGPHQVDAGRIDEGAESGGRCARRAGKRPHAFCSERRSRADRSSVARRRVDDSASANRQLDSRLGRGAGVGADRWSMGPTSIARTARVSCSTSSSSRPGLSTGGCTATSTVTLDASASAS
jgi:hypothetical protein